MRAVTFVSRLTLEVAGTVAQNAVYLGDVDSDGAHELVVGTEGGDLLVFKGTGAQAWRRCSGLGFITAIGVGDLLNRGSNVLVVVSGCGWVNIFSLTDKERKGGDMMTPLHTQRLPANVKDLIICDVNGDGSSELVVSLTDRVVRTYRWVQATEEFSPPGSPTEPQPSGSGEETPSSHLTPGAANSFGLPPYLLNCPPGRLVSVHKWEFASQIGTITCNIDTDGSPCLLVAQPGGAFMKLRCNQVDETDQVEGEEPGLDEDQTVLSSMSVEYEPLGVHRRRNPNVSAEILGGFVSEEPGAGTRYAIVTLDGTVMLVDRGDRQPMESILWNLQVDHQLMCLSKLDVTGDGQQEVIACSWDGQTYIISQDRQAVRFQFEESVLTFTAGLYSLGSGGEEPPTPALVYVTFTNKIQLYFGLGLEGGIKMSSLIHCPGNSKDKVDTKLDQLGVDRGNLEQLQQVYRYLLYQLPRQGSVTES